MLILGIETSCDDTCAAVLQDGDRVLSSVVSSQEEIHAKYGGIVPELASRRHLECIIPVIQESLEQAGCTLQHIDAIAVTQGPGLIGSLLVGLSTAKAMAYSHRLPLVAVHHLQGHLLSPQLGGRQVPYPHLGLVISGGHTALYRVDAPLEIKFIGETRDDAAGEAFDKLGKCLGLPFPGGPNVERAAGEDSTDELIPFPKPRFKTGGFQFSFSGLKTAAAQYIESRRGSGDSIDIPKICRSFQKVIVDCLTEQAFGALQAEELHAVTVSGGVAANGALRQQFEQMAEKHDGQMFFAEKRFCTDNAAMIAAAGYHKLRRQGAESNPLEINAFAQMPLGKETG